MDKYTLTLAFGGLVFMGFVAWCVVEILLTAHREDPGCLDPRH